ncbi:hypothetical protein KPH14_009468 [Odynerus spinipes]|uniref:Uncharacterized protein n=1 Tax=Odynerus spinipes TaxID=1348599 RepID=A0AAD9RPN3_9HYME|nr:hypothetical protein KPH14_009468 [Odynerus spinipes]
MNDDVLLCNEALANYRPSSTETRSRVLLTLTTTRNWPHNRAATWQRVASSPFENRRDPLSLHSISYLAHRWRRFDDRLITGLNSGSTNTILSRFEGLESSDGAVERDMGVLVIRET